MSETPTASTSIFPTIPIPQPIRRFFDAFPLLTLPPTPLPARSPAASNVPSLYVFSTPENVAAGKPSFNPACLKWQTYLMLSGIEFQSIPSSNHASPSGSLPFLRPGAAESNEQSKPVTSAHLVQWVKDHGKPSQDVDPSNPELVAFTTLLDTRIRDAWLYALYLEPRNFNTLAIKQYCQTAIPLVNKLLAWEYRNSAFKELCKTRPGAVLSSIDIYADADSAFSSLATLLADQGGDWFFGAAEPGLFDATVYSYTHLILTLPWDRRAATLQHTLRKYDILVAHERRLHALTFARDRRKKSSS
ncbi:hypothetical protein EX30DRAFT_346051 [Ascodesmis nigricans]|uniref:Thioredoxin-like fold domain-containing protein n=1 Tax=Ascodesmis nigricans TaxID=341454 RepID=A0A4S2N816_9PEZI|nr:hypothetical protein EX30DRAFT_346051 [Ascodesmis nigricans]